MQVALRRPLVGGSLFAALALFSAPEAFAAPTAQDALKLSPVQKDVEIDMPSAADLPGCTIKAEKYNGNIGWVVRDGSGEVLRKFVDTNGDNVVDQWSYFVDGIEAYRDIDSNFNGKADQFRWLNTAGSRWGMDKNEDGRIDSWQSISAEEASAEVIAAMAQQDAARFARLLITSEELASLGLGEPQIKDITAKVSAASNEFKSVAPAQKIVGKDTRWVQFGGMRPGVVPAGTDGSTKDLIVYENVVSVVETAGQHNQVQIGTLIRVGDTWRVIDVPRPIGDGQGELAASGFFFRTSLANRPDQLPGGAAGNDAQIQELLGQLEKLDKASDAAQTPEEQAKMMAEKADLLEKIAATVTTPEDRSQWLRQLADTISAAVQTGTWPDGVERLKALYEKLAKDNADEDLIAYVEFRYRTVVYYSESLRARPGEFPKIEAAWLDSLRKFVADHPKSSDTPEAMLQLAIAQDVAGEEEDAKHWYRQIVEQFRDSGTAQKAAGSLTRLDSVGKSMQLRGPSPDGKSVVDLSKYLGKVVLIHYWATRSEPAKVDLAQLKELSAKFGKQGFAIIGVSLDNNVEDLNEYLKRNRLPWAQTFEPGGLDSRLANEMGILSLPTMILVDKEGKVVNRNIHVTELDKEIGNLLR